MSDSQLLVAKTAIESAHKALVESSFAVIKEDKVAGRLHQDAMIAVEKCLERIAALESGTKGNVVSLNDYKSESSYIIEELAKGSDYIQSITAIITWDNGEMTVAHEIKEVGVLCQESLFLNHYLTPMILGDDGYTDH